MAPSGKPVKIGDWELYPSEIAVLAAEAEGWIAEDGDTLEGHVLAVRAGHSVLREEKTGDGRYPIVIVYRKTGDGDYEAAAFHAFQEIAYNEVINQQPKVGDEIFVKRIGADPDAAPVKGRNAPIRWAILVTKPDAQTVDVYAQFRRPNGSDYRLKAAGQAAPEAPDAFNDRPDF